MLRYRKACSLRLDFRKLRIAWSVACGILCVLLIVFWVRSYSWVDCTSLFGKIPLASFRGDILINTPMVLTFSSPNPYRAPPVRYGIWSFPSDTPGLIIWDGGWTLPYWLSLVSTVAIGTAPWLRWRFGLRTLLIGMTVVAAVLGLVIALRGS
jgi:hypothetical protein